MAKKFQTYQAGGLRKVLQPAAVVAPGTTIAGLGNTTITLAQLAALLNAATAVPNTQTDSPSAALVTGPGLSGGGELIGAVPLYFTAPIPVGDCDLMEGEPGPPGVGVRGAQGLTGLPGIPGITIPGEDGIEGEPGTPGVGIQGVAGATGRQGYTIPGEDGAEGEPGVIIPSTASGGSLSITDGTHTVSGVTALAVTGGTVGGATPNATLLVSGSSEPFNVTPDTHGSIPTGVGLGPNDEFETGATIDTAGTRYSGATPWAWLSQGAATASIGSQGALVLTGATDGLPHSVIQPVPGTTPYTYTMKFSQWASSVGSGTAPAMILYNSTSQKLYLFSLNSSGDGSVVYAFTNPTTFSATAAGPITTVGIVNLSSSNIQNWWYYRVTNNGTNLIFQASITGVEGSYVTQFTLALSAFISSVSHIGVVHNNNVAGAICVFDWFRRTS